MSMKTAYSTIIDSLSPKCISQNNKEDFWHITKHFLCVGAITTKKREIPDSFRYEGMPDLFRYEGWYRFFNGEEVGPLELFAGGINDPVASDDEARLCVMDRAISDFLINPCECPSDLVALPHQVCIITARKSLQQDLDALMKETDSENLSPLCSRLKEYLSWLYRLEVSIVPEKVVKTIYSLQRHSPATWVTL